MKKRLCSFLFLAALYVFSGDLTLAENGIAQAGIVIPEKAKPVVLFAAKELKTHLDAMTGADFVIGTKTSKPCSIRLGFGNTEKFIPDEYVISVKERTVEIYGRDSDRGVILFDLFYDNPYKGTLSGVYGFLDSLGIRWPAPGAAHVPKKKTVSIQEGFVRFKPVFKSREIADAWNFIAVYPDAKEYVQHTGDIYLWGLRNGASTRSLVPGCHSEHALGLFRNSERMKEQDSWKLGKDGIRNKNYSCWTSPATKKYWLKAADAYFSGISPQNAGFDLKGYLHSKWPMPFIISDEFMIDPMDHSSDEDGRCWCKRCDDFRRKYKCADDTEIIWKVISEIAVEIGRKHPGKYISTLVYPPKCGFPKYFPPPPNVRVRICLTGPRNLNFPNCLAGDMALLKKWADALGRGNIPLWCYQCTASFGRSLPGIPDTYPHLIASYLKKIQPFCSGMFLENHNLTHTFRNLDVYIFLRMAYNPSRNIEKELSDYFSAYYGPAAGEVQAFFQSLETNWNAIDKLIRNDDYETGSLGVSIKNKKQAQKLVWSRVYTLTEMDRLDTILNQAENTAKNNTCALERVKRLRKWLFEIMKAERLEVMSKEDARKNIVINAGYTEAKTSPAENEWKTAEEYALVQAVRMAPEIRANGKFRMLASQDRIFIRAELLEPEVARSATRMDRRSGDREIWKDNGIELFFYSMRTKKFWQIIVNDNGAWASQTSGRILKKWTQFPGLTVRTFRKSAAWHAEISIPLSELKINGGELRFNLTRERNIKGIKPEFSTWSPLAMIGNWHDPENYGTIILK